MTKQQTFLSRLFVVLILLCGTLFPVYSALAQNNGDPPTRADVQSQLYAINKQKDLTPDEKLQQKDLTETLETLDKITRIKQETVALKTQVAQAPEKLRQATDALNSISTENDDVQTRAMLASLSLRQLESRVSSVLDDLQAAQNDLSAYNSQLVSLQKQRDYTTAHINQLEHSLQLLQEAVNSKRLTLTEKNVQEAVTPDEATSIQNNPLVRQELEINHQLSQRLITATENGNNLVQRNIRVKNWLDRALQSERNINEQISVLKGSLLLSRILYQQQQTLPSADELEDMTNRIADLRLEQFDVNQQRDALFQSDVFVDKIEEGHKAEVNDDVHDALLQVVDMRRELLDQLNKQLGNQLMMAINLQIYQQQLVSVSTSLQAKLTQQIFWVNSNKPMNCEWVKAFPGALHAQLKGIKIDFSLKKVLDGLFVSLFTALPLLLIAGLIRWRFRWIDKKLEKLAADVGQLRSDSQLNAPKAIAFNLLKVLPATLAILALGLVVLFMQTSNSDLLWSFAKELALFWLVFGLTWQVLGTNCMAVTHFNMPEQLTRHYRRQIVRISLALLPLLYWSVVGEHSPLHLMDDVLGQFMIFLNLLLITALVIPMCRDNWRDKESHTMRLVTMTVLSIVPIALWPAGSAGAFTAQNASGGLLRHYHDHELHHHRDWCDDRLWLAGRLLG